ncbi:MAG: hypothetical protein IJ009_08255 [Clostridia bacterium]|nr:hypothetical protein [Clostridia bacterium]
MDISVVSFNIRCANDPNGHSISERAPRLGSVMEPLGADLIGFQEYVPEWEPYIAEAFGVDCGIFNRWRAEANRDGVPILWHKDKFDCLKTGCFWLSDTPDAESRGWDRVFNCYRICTYAVLRHKENGTEFVFMNTHFGGGDDCQVKSADLIASRSKEISDLPTFIIGDFNMTPDTKGYAAMTAHFTDANAVTAKDARATFHGYEPSAHPDEHIDYCFVGEGIVPVSHTLLDGTVDGKHPSDHYGLHIKFSI